MKAVVTGAGTGIGAAAACHLARGGVRVALVGRRAALLEETAARIQNEGGSASVHPVDISRAQERERLVHDITTTQADVHVLLHNAAQMFPGALTQHSAAQIQAAVDTNLTAALDLTRLFLPHIIQTRGVIAFVLSNASVVPMPYMTLYNTTKAALQAFAKALRYETAAHGVRVLLIYPPDTLTPMTSLLRERAPFTYPLADADAVGRWIANGILSRKQHLRTWDAAFLLRAVYHLAPALVEGVFHANRRLYAKIMDAVS